MVMTKSRRALALMTLPKYTESLLDSLLALPGDKSSAMLHAMSTTGERPARVVDLPVCFIAIRCRS